MKRSLLVLGLLGLSLTLSMAACAAEEAAEPAAPAEEAPAEQPAAEEPAAEEPAEPEAPMVMAPEGMPALEGAAVADYVLNASPYADWGTWPTDDWNDFSQFLVSGEPHGNVVRVFVNDTALMAAAADGFDGSLPAGSMVLKENYMGTDPTEPGELAALTIMYKVDGFNPDANDWFWVKASPDGATIEKEGAVEGCIACHSQPNNSDYLLRYGFGNEPAVPSLGGVETADAG